jgi:hypothetical protein
MQESTADLATGLFGGLARQSFWRIGRLDPSFENLEEKDQSIDTGKLKSVPFLGSLLTAYSLPFRLAGFVMRVN